MRTFGSLTTSLIVLAIGFTFADEGDGARALALYRDGRYAEALPVLRALDEAGAADGADLYRLFFCLRVTGDGAGARATLERAAAALRSENETATSLEVPFYLANALRNLGRAAEARTVAAEATAKVESGTWPVPTEGIRLFRLAKLYEDQGKSTEASSRYLESVAAFAKEGETFPDNVRWARRYVGTVALERGDDNEAARQFGALAEDELAESADYEALARCRARLGEWSAAADAWSGVIRVDPANANDARYSAQLARVAATLDSLAASAPGDRAWADLSRSDLETVMTEQAVALGEARAAAGGATESAEREELQKRIDDIRRVFVTAGLQYATRGFPIRETAFSGGYATLIFRSDPWSLPPQD